MKILMATDGSENATAALRTASRFLRGASHEISVLCAAPEMYAAKVAAAAHGRSARIRENYRQLALTEMGEILQRARQVVRAEGFEVEVLPCTGSAADMILRLANGYDMVVVGAHGRTGMKPGLGPVASQVVQHAPGTVLIAREMISEGSFRILLAVDGSRASELALRFLASSCFDIGSSEVALMHVVETPWIGLDRDESDESEGSMDMFSVWLELGRELRLEADEVIEDARRVLVPYGSSVRTIVAVGNPATEILGEAESGEYDLIVLGATGASDLKHSMLGSVSTKVGWNAPCSVAIVKQAS